METRKAFKKEQEDRTLEEQCDTNENIFMKEIAIKEESVEEQFVEISTNTRSKMDYFSNDKGKALTKDETRGLLELILRNPIITSKETNATLNQQKIIEWNQIAEDFNTTYSVCYPRTPKQLRLKWENLKKSARRRNAKIRLNHGKTDLNSESMSRDEILEKVSTVLHKRPKDTQPLIPTQNDDSDDSDDDTPLIRERTARGFIPITTEKQEADDEENLESHKATAAGTNVAVSHKMANGISGLSPRKRKFRTDDGREARNRAMAAYYTSKTRLLHFNLMNIKLQNEKLRLEIELLKRNYK